MENTVGQHRVAQPTTALVPATRQEANKLVVSAVRSILTEKGQSIGVSKNWLVQHVERLGLNQEQVEILISVRSDFRGLLPHAVKFLYKGTYG